ncbi:30S ribosomal protein S13 [Candidatus Bathyarchaeota archaeon]|nr:30S ribosomal protein S13 [Candidatus Bathyarchaeota archaeon]MDP6048105.1 30S ribosomal protein S13 [Candidatus Bathyarchaeota archaeon]MDP7443360.1 30S ribosomal protein S13 [Candidatus Bathyarchaeota archaeon]
MSKEFNYIVRLHGSNLDGTKLLPYAMTDLKGIGIRVARTMIKKLALDPSERLGNLSKGDVGRLENIIDNPSSHGIPLWMLNRRKDPQTGLDRHLLASDLTLAQRQDIDVMRETRSWKGERHARGLKVRGQRTKTTARKGRSVGVSRARIQQKS